MSRNALYRKLINSARWKKLRARQLQSNPLCEACRDAGRTRLAEEVHHRIPVESAPNEAEMTRLMFAPMNLQSLCHDCHVEIHKQLFSHTKATVKANRKRETQRFVDKFL